MVVAVDIGGLFIKIGILKDSEIIDKTSIVAIPSDPFQTTMDTIVNTLQALLRDNLISKKEVKGIGIAFPGLVDSVDMKVLSSSARYPDANTFDFKNWADNILGIPVFLENDTRVSLLGEWQYGIGRGIDNIVMLTFGTGVGSATIIEGKILRGKHFQAGNLGGHFTINVDGEKCVCGNIGCVETEASTWKLANLLKPDPAYSDSLIKGNELDFKSLFKYAAEGGELSIKVKNHCLDVWSAAIINQIHAYDPEMVILGGGVMKSADTIVPFIKKIVNKHTWTPWGQVNIVESTLLSTGALRGLYYLVSEKLELNE